MSVTIRHRLPGRTRLDLGPTLPEAALERLRALLAEAGHRLLSASAVTRSIVVEHDRATEAPVVAGYVADCIAGPAFDPAVAPEPTAASRAPGDDEPARIALLPVADLVAELAADIAGLSGDEAVRRLAVHGANRTTISQARSPVEMLWRQLATAPVALLAGSAVLSIATGGLFDAAVTVGVVAINAAVGFVSEESTERLIRRLSKPVEHHATTLRDGEAKVVLASAIVPGDVVMLSPGSVVPADARLIRASDLTIDESMLTGESLPVEKSAETLTEAPRGVADRANLVHAGTVVTGGDAVAIVFRTGRQSEMARTHALIGSARPPRPAIEEDLARLSSKLTLGCIGISALVFGTGVVRGEPVIQMARSAIALAVAAIPEGLPAVATTTLALGARALEREGAFVRSLPAVESIGTVDTICLDKTGTLTVNRMAVVAVHDGGTAREAGSGGTWTTSDATLPGLSEIAEAVALCNEAHLSKGTGSATESALLQFATEIGLDTHAVRHAAPITAMRNRNHSRHWMATEHRLDEGQRVYVKGAPDQVLGLATHRLADGAIAELDSGAREAILEANRTLARKGLRLLGVARRDGALGDGPVSDLVWLGLVALADPIRAEAKEAVDLLHGAGVRTILITGDQAATGLSVAESLSLSRSGILNVIEGWEIAGLDDAALGEIALKTSVFARVSPADKLRIVKALQSVGRRVAMIGDGINDGPALREASVGIAMGKKGTSVAREVADIVIADDDLGRLAQVIARGRATEDNVRSAIRYLLATNLSEVLVAVVESLRGHGELETPMELFWLNLVTDIMPALGLSLAEPRGDTMARPPRSGEAPLFDKGETSLLIGDGIGIATAALIAHFYEVARAGPGPITRSATFLSLALSQIAYAWALRDRSPDAGNALVISERRLEAMLAAAGGLLSLPFIAPPLRGMLGIAPLSAGRFGLSALLAAAAFLFAEGRRTIRLNRQQGPTVPKPPVG